MYWETPDKHSWERETKVTGSTEENRRSGIEGEIQKISRQLWAAEQTNTQLNYLTTAQIWSTAQPVKSLVAGFTEAVKLRKTPAPRVRELQNPLPPTMESHIPVHRTLLSASQQAGQKGRAKRSSQNSWRNKRSGSCCAMIASQPNAPWSTAGAFHLIWSVRKSHSTNSWLQHFMEGRRDTSCIVQITQI